MNEFEEMKAELMDQSLEELLEQLFSGSYVPGPMAAAIRIKVAELRRLNDVCVKCVKAQGELVRAT